MKWFLEMLGPEGPTEQLPLEEGQTVHLGRGRTCTIRLKDPQMSRLHCLLRFRKGRWEITDLGSRNGIYVNDHKVQKVKFSPGDLIFLGGNPASALPRIGPARGRARDGRLATQGRF